MTTQAAGGRRFCGVVELPRSASAVVIGGGVIGTSVAFHLAEAGVRDVVLLDAGPLGGGSSSKAAGGVRAMFSDRVNIELGRRSLEAFAEFGTRPGAEIDLHRAGYLFLLDDPDGVRSMTAAVAAQNELGVPSRMIDPDEAVALCPLVSAEGLLAAAYSPTDGHCTPEAVVQGYATGARRLGATLVPNCAVRAIDVTTGRIGGVVTERGRIATDTVVCAAGAWSGEVGALAGVDLPVTPLRRQILVTEPVAGLPDELPMTIDFSTSFYFHREGPGLLMGMSDPDEQPGFRLGRSDTWLPRLAEVIARRAPRLDGVGVRTGWAGLYEMTPDHNGLIGEAEEVSRFLYATGFSGHGFLMGPALGEVVRDLVLGRPPVVDVGALDVARLHRSDLRPEINVV